MNEHTLKIRININNQLEEEHSGLASPDVSKPPIEIRKVMKFFATVSSVIGLGCLTLAFATRAFELEFDDKGYDGSSLTASQALVEGVQEERSLIEKASDNSSNAEPVYPKPIPVKHDLKAESRSPISDQLAVEAPNRILDANQKESLVLSSVVIHSPNIKRLVLTDKVKSREPVKALDGVISSEDILNNRLYLFTEIIGLPGESITHEWIYNDQTVARVNLNVGSTHWRTNSSKRMMNGQWAVEVVTSKGELLAEASFEFN